MQLSEIQRKRTAIYKKIKINLVVSEICCIFVMERKNNSNILKKIFKDDQVLQQM